MVMKEAKRSCVTPTSPMAGALSSIDETADKLAIPLNVRVQASRLCREAVEEGFTGGRELKSVAAASLCIACRLTGTPITFKTLAMAFHKRRKDIFHQYQFLVRTKGIMVPIADLTAHVPAMAEKLGIGTRAQRWAQGVLTDAKAGGIVAGKDPLGFVAAALYIACAHEGENKKPQRMFAEVARVTENTFQKRRQDLQPYFGSAFPQKPATLPCFKPS